MKIRKTNKLYFKITISVLLLSFALYRLQFSDEGHKIGVEVYISLIGIFGLLVKIILGLIFPEIILDNEGIKFFGRKKILWKDIKNIKINENSEILKISIEKVNSKIIHEQYKNLGVSKYEMEENLAFFLIKYGNPFYKKEFQEQQNASPVCFANSNEVRDEYK